MRSSTYFNHGLPLCCLHVALYVGFLMNLCSLRHGPSSANESTRSRFVIFGV
jgi:hypothetical protein